MIIQDQNTYNNLTTTKLQKESTTLNNVFFSIITPVFNSSKYLTIFFESIINQTFKNFELIIIDDGSTDTSLKKINYYKDKIRFIKIIQQQNSGQGIARNKALRLANGEYVLFIDSDDSLSSSDSLEQLYSFIVNKPSDLVIYAYQKVYYKKFYHDSGNQIAFLKNNTLVSTLPEKEKMLSQKRIGMPGNKAYKRAFLEENNIKFAENLKFEDVYFFWQSTIYATKITFFSTVLYNYSKHNNSTMATNSKKNMDIVAAYSLVINFLIKENLLDNFIVILLNRSFPSFLSQFKKIPFKYKREFFISLKQFNVKYGLHRYSNNIMLYYKTKKILRLLNTKSFWKFYLKSFLI